MKRRSCSAPAWSFVGRHIRSAVAILAIAAAAGETATAAGAAGPARPGPAAADRPITLVVPFAAKGPTDTVARALAAAMTAVAGRAVVVENHPGSGGTVGAAAVAGAPADGNTLLLHHVGMATAPVLYRSLPYDPRRDFEPVGRVVDVPMTLVARPDFPARTLPQAIALVRREQASLLVAYAGMGAASHLCGLLLSLALKVDLIQVPYRGTGPALADLQEGRADLMCDQTTNTAAPIRSGRVVGLGVTSARRLAGMPMLPSVAEAGIQGLDLAIWHGLFAPRGTPAAVLADRAGLLRAALAAPAFVAAMNDMQAVIAPPRQATPEALAALLTDEIARWAPILRKAGQYAD